MTTMSKLTIAFMWAANLAIGAYVLAKHFSSFGEPALLLFIGGLAGVTVFTVYLWQRVGSGEIAPRIAGDLAVRSLLSSGFVLLTLGWILRR